MAGKTIGTGISLDGEKEFRQSIKAIKSDMAVLGSEMTKVTSEFKDNKNSMEALTAQQKVLDKQYEKQTEKVNVLKKALENAKKEYPDNTEKINNWQIELNRAETGLNILTKEIDKNKSAMEKAKPSTDDLGKEVKQVGDNADKAGGHLLNMGDVIKANLISGAVITGVKALGNAFVDVTRKAFDLTKGVIDLAGEIDDNSKKVGMSAGDYQEWTYAAKMAGMEQSTLTSLMEKQQKSFTDAIDGSKGVTLSLEDQKLAAINLEKAQNAVSEAVKKHGKNSLEAREATVKLEQMQKKTTNTTNAQADAYKKLGIDIKKMTGPSQAFDAVLNALSEVEDETERNSIANDIFGKSYADLTPLLKEGKDGMNALRKEARDLGGVMSDETVEAGAELGDTLDSLKVVLNSVVIEVAEELMPVFQGLGDWVIDNKEEIKEFAEKSLQKVGDTIEFVSENADVLVPLLGTLVSGFVALKVIDGVTAGMAAFNLVMTLNPIGLTIAAIAALGLALVAVIKNWDDIIGAIKSAWNWLTRWNDTPMSDKYSTVHISSAGVEKGGGGRSFTPTSSIKSGYAAYDIGSRYIPYDMTAVVHEGEMIVPKSENPYANSTGRIMPAGGINITGNQFIINNDLDIDYVAKELAYRTQRELGGAGLAYSS